MMHKHIKGFKLFQPNEGKNMYVGIHTKFINFQMSVKS